MAGDVDNARIWGGADFYTAPLGTVAPTDLTTAWAAAWDALGLLGEDGMNEEQSDDTQDHWAWGNIRVRRTRSRHTRSITVVALEDNDIVFKLLNPGSTSTTTTGVTTRAVKVPTSEIKAFGAELRDGTITKRIVIPRGEVITVGARTMSESSMAMRELTVDVYPGDDDLLYYEITDDPGAAVAA